MRPQNRCDKFLLVYVWEKSLKKLLATANNSFFSGRPEHFSFFSCLILVTFNMNMIWKVVIPLHESDTAHQSTTNTNKCSLLVAQQLYLASCFFACVFVFELFVPSDPHTKSQVHTQPHKPDQIKININGFDMAKNAAQLLYGPILIFYFIWIQEDRKQTPSKFHLPRYKQQYGKDKKLSSRRIQRGNKIKKLGKSISIFRPRFS